MITVIENNALTSEIHVHATGCSSITDSEAYFAKNFVTAMETYKYESELQAAIDYFGEVAADHFEWDSDEWLEEVMCEWERNTHVFPCAK